MLKKFFDSDVFWYGMYFSLPCMIALFIEQLVHPNYGVICTLFYLFCERRKK